MDVIKDSLTFDDVTLVPQYSSVLPSEANVSTKLAHNLNLRIPLISSAMDTVTEFKMATALAKSGGIGIIHRNLSIEKQVQEVKKVKKIDSKLLTFTPGIRLEPNNDDQKRTMTAKEAMNEGSDYLILGRPLTSGNPKENIQKIIKSLE